jgi:DNA-binding NarL/FixJ family response regulator
MMTMSEAAAESANTRREPPMLLLLQAGMAERLRAVLQLQLEAEFKTLQDKGPVGRHAMNSRVRELRELIDGIERLPAYTPSEEQAPLGAALTPRETEVLQHLRLGRSNAEIAAALCISVETARTHTARVLRKLGVRSKWQLVSAQSGARIQPAARSPSSQGKRGPHYSEDHPL